jgi:hypothetical protein
MIMGKQGSADKTIREIRRKTRRKFSAEEKIRIVIEGLRGEESISGQASLLSPGEKEFQATISGYPATFWMSDNMDYVLALRNNGGIAAQCLGPVPYEFKLFPRF